MDKNESSVTALQERLQDPETAAALNRILDRLDTLESAIDRLSSMMEKAPGLVSMAVDTVDDEVARAADAGVDIDARLRAGMALAERITDPATMAKLDQLITLAERAPDLVSMLVDSFDDAYLQMLRAGVNADIRLKAAVTALERLTAPETLSLLAAVLREPEQFHALVESGVFDPGALKVIGFLGRALSISHDEDTTRLGLVGVLRSTQDPDVKRALGFLVNVGKLLGQSLNGKIGTEVQKREIQ